MKPHVFLLAALCLALTACTRSHTVNILISNTADHTLENHIVEVSMADLHANLTFEDGDSLIVLNEKNQPVGFQYNADRTAILFTVPLAQRGSQKNFSVSTGRTTLADNLFALRTRKILVNLQ